MDELANLGTHWPLLALAVALGALGGVAKTLLWSRPLALWSRLGRASMPAHPVLLGAGLAMIPGFPVTLGAGGLVTAALYGALAGVLSTWLYEAVRRRLEKAK